MRAEELPLSLCLSLSFFWLPRGDVSPQKCTHLHPSVLSASLTHSHTESPLEAEWSTEGWRWSGSFSFRQSVYVTVCLINEWLSFIQLTDTQCSVYVTVWVWWGWASSRVWDFVLLSPDEKPTLPCTHTQSLLRLMPGVSLRVGRLVRKGRMVLFLLLSILIFLLHSYQSKQQNRLLVTTLQNDACDQTVWTCKWLSPSYVGPISSAELYSVFKFIVLWPVSLLWFTVITLISSLPFPAVTGSCFQSKTHFTLSAHSEACSGWKVRYFPSGVGRDQNWAKSDGCRF